MPTVFSLAFAAWAPMMVLILAICRSAARADL
jgi:hypothetical protein